MAVQQERSMQQRLSDDERWERMFYNARNQRSYQFVGDINLRCNLYYMNSGDVILDAWFDNVLVLETNESIVGREDEVWESLEKFIAVKDHYEASASAGLRCKHCKNSVNTATLHLKFCRALKPLVKSAYKS